MHKWIYNFSVDRHIHTNFKKLMDLYNTSTQQDLWGQLGNKLTPTGVVHVPTLVSQEFCDALLEELEAIQRSGLPLTRPNSMNHYGVVLSEFGFDQLWQQLFNYVKPFLIFFYGDIVNLLDSYHAFIVQYKMTEQKGLGFHYDASEVTLNLCLGKSFSDGDLYFKGLYFQPETHSEEYIYSHKTGQAIFHYGEHRHGALPITQGSRYNLIIWYKASSLRQHSHTCTCNKHSKPEQKPPSPPSE